MPRGELLASKVLEESALREILAQRARPHPDARARLMNLAVSYARSQLRDTGHQEIRHPLAALYAYLARHPEPARRTCAMCGSAELPDGAAYCSNTCRQRAYRLRRR